MGETNKFEQRCYKIEERKTSKGQIDPVSRMYPPPSSARVVLLECGRVCSRGGFQSQVSSELSNGEGLDSDEFLSSSYFQQRSCDQLGPTSVPRSDGPLSEDFSRASTCKICLT